ncbi:pentapeptide repeat-containing protein [Steroidobacter flavus]|uniref:Pentapeptide repeat-containing protein n=1 Tax=Steroidobacter flavus TaxID=1842136 RepID=A0ABV8T0J2_9GAMM
MSMGQARSTPPFIRRRHDARDALTQQKLALEIRDLQRSAWTRPAIIVPIAVSLATLGLSQYLGIFDVERKRIEVVAASAELRNREAEMRHREIEIARARTQSELRTLRMEREQLGGEKQRLIKDRDQLIQDITELRAQTDRTEQLVREATETSRQLIRGGWEHDARQSLQLAEQERFHHLLNTLSEPDVHRRQQAIMALRGYLSEANGQYHSPALLALSGALASEPAVAVRTAIVATLAEVRADLVPSPALRGALSALIDVNRGLITEIKMNYPPRRPLLPAPDRAAEANLQATADAIATLLRKGVQEKTLTSLYLGKVDLSGLELTDTIFDGSILTGTKFSDAKLAGASFDNTDLEHVDFRRADLRDTRFTQSVGSRYPSIHWNYVHLKIDDPTRRRMPLAPPDFGCADLRNAHFTDYPLIPLIADQYKYADVQLYAWPASFAFANLAGADFQHIQAFGAWAPDDDRSPFHRGTGITTLSKPYRHGTYRIEENTPLTSDAADFSKSLIELSRAFDGANWQEARLPRSILQWLQAHPPQLRDLAVDSARCP